MHAVFRQTLSESAFVLKTQSNILGKCIKRSRPYYEKLEHAKKVLKLRNAVKEKMRKGNFLVFDVRVMYNGRND